MSKRTVDAIKAIRLAWEKEQELVREGKGTRDWTKEQQQDILNPDKGKAYDDKGRAFEGQHMKSVEEYPDYQGNPDNIQFLTREEHLEAHKGCWQNPTNWYFNPVTKAFVEFGSDEIIPCNIIELSDSIVVLRETEQCKSADKRGISKSSEVQKMPVTQKIAEYRAHKNGVSAESLVKLSLGDDKKVIKATLIEDGRGETNPVTQASLESGIVPKGQMSMGMLRSKVGGRNILVQANSLQNSINLSPKGIQR